MEASAVSKRSESEPRYAPVHVVRRHQSFDDEIEAVRRYLETVTSSFRQEIERYKQEQFEKAQGASQDEAQSLAEDLGEMEHYYVAHFPAFALQTTFVAIFTLVEDELLSLARLVGKKFNDLKDPEEVKYNGKKYNAIEKAKAFIEGHGLPFPAGDVWDEAQAYCAIRNAVAHHRGRLKRARKAKEIRAYVARNPRLLTIDQTDRLRLTDEFCTHVLDNAEALMHELFSTLCRRFAVSDD